MSDDDASSLFGSPPPAAFTLALPGAENVGSIALPGLPALRSEHSPPASRLRAPTPPAIFAPIEDRSPGPSSSSARPPRKKRKVNGAPQPRAPPPPLVLPEPGTQPPPDLLRGQAALLGQAGLVADVRPARLPRGGSAAASDTVGSAARPIVVPDDVTPPTALPLPPSAAVLSALSRSTNLSLVLSSLQRLLNESGKPRRQPRPKPPQPRARSAQEQEEEEEEGEGEAGDGEAEEGTEAAPTRGPLWAPPLKRRKLRRVPAGAADWDVPYPFRAGEGPETYALMWTRERLRALVQQLVTLLRAATRSAAARAYLQRVGADAQGAAIARDEARKIGRRRGKEKEQPPPQEPAGDPLLDGAAIEEILAGLYDVPQPAPQQSVTAAPNPMDDLIALYNSSFGMPAPTSDSNQPTADLNALFDGVQLPPAGAPDFNFDFDFSALDLPLDFPPDVAPAPSGPGIPEPPGWDWSLIDPALQPAPPPPAGPSAASTPALALSPTASAYSLGPGPATPHAPWGTGLDLFGEVDPLGGGAGKQMDFGLGPQDDAALDQLFAPDPAAAFGPAVGRVRMSAEDVAAAQTAAVAAAERARDAEFVAREAAAAAAAAAARRSSATAAAAPSAADKGKGKARATTAPPPAPPSAAKRATERAALLERARTRRGALEAELSRANLALWETMIEHSVLAHACKEATGGVPEDAGALAAARAREAEAGRGRGRGRGGKRKRGA